MGVKLANLNIDDDEEDPITCENDQVAIKDNYQFCLIGRALTDCVALSRNEHLTRSRWLKEDVTCDFQGATSSLTIDVDGRNKKCTKRVVVDLKARNVGSPAPLRRSEKIKIGNPNHGSMCEERIGVIKVTKLPNVYS
ncbi:hypothetical protein Gotri_004559, partial [Gossypium trilobum]|nr:hypothetical protein [Gossypium trilobum]